VEKFSGEAIAKFFCLSLRKKSDNDRVVMVDHVKDYISVFDVNARWGKSRKNANDSISNSISRTDQSSFFYFIVSLLHPPAESNDGESDDGGSDSDDSHSCKSRNLLTIFTRPLDDFWATMDLEEKQTELRKSYSDYNDGDFLLSHLIVAGKMRENQDLLTKLATTSKHCIFNMERSDSTERAKLLSKLLSSLFPQVPNPPRNMAKATISKEGGAANSSSTSHDPKSFSSPQSSKGSTRNGNQSENSDEDDDDYDDRTGDIGRPSDFTKLNLFQGNESKLATERAVNSWYPLLLDSCTKAVGQSQVQKAGGVDSLAATLLHAKRVHSNSLPPFFHSENKVLYIGSHDLSVASVVLVAKKLYPSYVSIIQAMPFTIKVILTALTQNLGGAFKDLRVIAIMGPGIKNNDKKGKSKSNPSNGTDNTEFTEMIEEYLGVAFTLAKDVSTEIVYSSDGSDDVRPIYYFVHKNNMNLFKLRTSKHGSKPGDLWGPTSKLPKPIRQVLKEKYNTHAEKLETVGLEDDQGTQRSSFNAIRDLLTALQTSFHMNQNDVFMDIGGGEGFVMELARVFTKTTVCASDSITLCRNMARHYDKAEHYTENDLGENLEEGVEAPKPKKQKKQNGGQ